MLVNLATFVALLVTLTAATPMLQASGTPQCTTGIFKCCAAVEEQRSSSILIAGAIVKGASDVDAILDVLPVKKPRAAGALISLGCNAITDDNAPCGVLMCCPERNTAVHKITNFGCTPPTYA